MRPAPARSSFACPTTCCRKTSSPPGTCRSTSPPAHVRRGHSLGGRRPTRWRRCARPRGGTSSTHPRFLTPISRRTIALWSPSKTPSKLLGRVSRRYRPFDPFERGGPFEPGREIRLPQIPRRFWGGVALFALAVLVFIAASPIVSFITDLQWYDALGFRDVYTTRLTLEWSLAIGATVLAFLYLARNVAVALRIRSGGALRAVGIERPTLRGPAGWISLRVSAGVSPIPRTRPFSPCPPPALL